MKKRTVTPVCRHIAKRKLFANKMQGIFMMAAAVLTTVLFTAAFTAVFGFRTSMRQVQMELAAWTAHAAISDVTDEQYERMRQSSVVSKISSYRHLGFVTEDVQDSVIELQYSEELMASWMYYELTDGRMPQAENEIAVSAQFLENKGIRPEDAKGTQIHIQYTVNDHPFSGDFIVTGYYDKKASSSEAAFISEAFFYRAMEQVRDEHLLDGVLGVRVVEVMFPNTFRMKKNLAKLLVEAGAEENKSILNPAFTMDSSLGAGGVFAVACVLLLIMCCGYFIIYNIFYISVMQDTRFYGSLATLGFYGWELKQIVIYKTNLLCAAAIPAGLVLGYILSMSVLPQILQTFGVGSVQAPNPMLFVCAAVFSYLTMRISSRKPAKLASEMSPAGAKRYTVLKQNRKVIHVSENGHKLYRMAWKNIVRERKKSILICCSLAVCMILTSLFAAVSGGADMETFIQDSISCDFIVAGRQLFNRTDPDVAAVDESLFLQLQQWEGMQGCGGAHVTEMAHVTMDSSAYQRYKDIINAAEEEDTNNAGEMYTKVYGLDAYICSKMELIKGELDWEKFQTGNYVMVNKMIESYHAKNPSDSKSSSDTGSCYEPGDKLKLDSSDEKEYTVLAVADIPYDLSAHGQYGCSVDIFLPSDEWMERMQSQDYYLYAYDVEDAYETQWESSLSEFTAENTDISYVSKAVYREEYEGFFRGVLIVGVAVSIILGTIGLMNFVNVMYSSIYERRRELAVMQSMGMLKKQVYRLLTAEGGYYMLASWLAGMIVGVPFSYFVTDALGSVMPFIHYQWNLTPYILFGAVGCLLAVSVPCFIFHTMDKKEDLLCRLREP